MKGPLAEWKKVKSNGNAKRFDSLSWKSAWKDLFEMSHILLALPKQRSKRGEKTAEEKKTKNISPSQLIMIYKWDNYDCVLLDLWPIIIKMSVRDRQYIYG